MLGAPFDRLAPEQHPEPGPGLLLHHHGLHRHLVDPPYRPDGATHPVHQLVHLGIVGHRQGHLDGHPLPPDLHRPGHAQLPQRAAEFWIGHRSQGRRDLGLVDGHPAAPQRKFAVTGRLGDVPPDPDSPSTSAGGVSRPGPQDAAAGSAESDSHFSAAVTAVTSAFGDPTRREIYLFVRSNPGANASEVAARFSLHPNVARHHLDRLATGGYVEVTMERAAGNGAGRPSKRFRAIGNDPTLDLLTRRDDLLVLLLQEALQLLGPTAAEGMAERVGEEYGRTLAGQMSPGDGQRSLRTAMHAIADTLTAHGFAAHAEDQGATTAVVADNCPFGTAASQYPVLCAVDRGMVKGLLAGLCGEDADGTVPVVLSSSRARGDDACAAVV